MKRVAVIAMMAAIGVLLGLLGVTVIEGLDERDRLIDDLTYTTAALESALRIEEARNARIVELRTELDAARRQLDEAQGQVVAARGEVAELSRRIAALSNQIASLGAEPVVVVPESAPVAPDRDESDKRGKRLGQR